LDIMASPSPANQVLCTNRGTTSKELRRAADSHTPARRVKIRLWGRDGGADVPAVTLNCDSAPFSADD
ncbi:MAG: hypothetical protein WCC59_10815, partial [Terriglobales bacterium]